MRPADDAPLLPRSAVENKAYYRPDIDGLRGVAVGLVVLYHLFPETFKNGFLGVDVFFVISGFVVTQALERNLHVGLLKGLKEFYVRRFKRILPALYFNTVVTIVLTCLFIPPTGLRSLFKTAASAVIGLSNVALLYARFDYFSPDLSLNPFVQTWSLGVEEQFYLFFPSMLLLCSSLASASRRLTAARLLTFSAGLSLAYWACLKSQAPVSAFYNPLARFWELLIGAVLALKKDDVASLIGARVGVLLQALAVASLTLALVIAPGDTGLDRFANIFVAAGSAMIIAVGIVSPRGLNGMLGSRPLVWVGEISYSLYLWHYSFFTLARWNLDLLRWSHAGLALLATLAVSYLSYRFIEIPFRYSSVRGARVIISGLGAGAVVLSFVLLLYRLPPARIYLGDAGRYVGLWPSSGEPLTASLKASQRECHLEYRDRWSPELLERCSTGRSERPFIYLIGNSHAQHLIPMLEAVSRERGYGYTALTISNCRLVSAYQIMSSINHRYDLCKEYFDRSTEHILRSARSGDIVLVGARSLILKPAPSDSGQPSNVYVGEKGLTYQEAYAKSVDDLAAFAAKLRAKDVRLVFTGPTPQFGLPATQCVPEWFRTDRKEGCRVAVRSVLEEKAGVLGVLQEIRSKSGNGHLWDPTAKLCDGAYCSASKGGRLLFRDQDHLAIHGAESLAPGFLEDIDTTGGRR